MKNNISYSPAAIVQALKAKGKGQFLRVDWTRPMKLRAKFAGAMDAVKVCSATVRSGVDYDNISSVQEKRATGELPSENAGLPWGEWIEFPYLIGHNGESYIRFTNAKNSVPKVTYFLNGKEVDRATVEPYCLGSEFSEKKPTEVFTIKACNITLIS